MLAGIGVGIYEDTDDAFQHVYRAGRRFEPDSERSAKYSRWFRTYRDLYPAVKPLNHQLFEEFLSSPLTKESVVLLERWAKEGGDGPMGALAAGTLEAMITNDHAQDLSEELQKAAAEALDRVLIEAED